MWYSTLFLRLYSKILEEDWIQNDINNGDVQQAIEYMHDVYRGSPENLSKETYRVTDYSKLAYRCAYLYKYAPFHTALVYETMSRAMAENPRVFHMLKTSLRWCRPFNVCSVGSGPGTDVIGVLAALYDKFRFFPAVAKLVDVIPEWETTFRSVVSELRLEKRAYGILSESVDETHFDWSFVVADLQEKLNTGLGTAIESADLITMVKFVSAVACKKTSQMVEKVFRTMRPGAMVLFIDNAAGGFQELITFAAKKYHLVPVFGPLDHELYVNETFNVEKFGYKSCYKTRVAVQLLVKLDIIQYSIGGNLSALPPIRTIYPPLPIQGHLVQRRHFNSDTRHFRTSRNQSTLDLRGCALHY